LGGITAVGLGLFLQLSKAVQPAETLLTIAAGEGGTTDPAPGTYTHRPTDTVQITAIPNAGYYVLGWTVDGVSKGSENTIYISMATSHNVAVAFTTTQPPPIRIPAKIVNLTAPPPLSLNVKQKYKGYWFWLDSNMEFHVEAITG